MFTIVEKTEQDFGNRYFIFKDMFVFVEAQLGERDVSINQEEVPGFDAYFIYCDEIDREEWLYFLNLYQEKMGKERLYHLPTLLDKDFEYLDDELDVPFNILQIIYDYDCDFFEVELSLWEGRPFELNDGRVLRFSKEKNEFEELVEGEWVEPSDKDSLGSVVSEALWPLRWE